ncbi:Protein of unknown function [Bacillus wiedmannii]|nr:Protein of unknown function [Bacillus wiedmannii]
MEEREKVINRNTI